MMEKKLFSFQKEKKENVISEESAENHLKAFLSYYDLSIDEMQTKEEKNMFKQCSKKVINAICDGRITIKDHESGYPEIEQRLKSGTIMTYGELNGRAKIAMKDCEENDTYGRIYALVGSLTKAGGDAIEQLKGTDLTVSESLGYFFLKA